MSHAGIQLKQPALPGMCPITDAVHVLAHHSEAADRGAIFTRREVVDFVLDLVRYTSNKPLHKRTLLEPSFGNGDFLLPALERLLAAWHWMIASAQWNCTTTRTSERGLR